MTRRMHLGPAALLTAALSIAALLVLAACGSTANGGNGGGGSNPASSPNPAGTPSATGNAVSITNFTFTPAKLTVAAGTKVTWTNQDSVAHNVASTDGPGLSASVTSLFASKSMNQGDTFSFTFTKAGTYTYECTIHASMPSMHAVVIVK